MTLKPCLVCGTPSTESRCKDHEKRYGYSDAHWKRVKAARLLYDNYVCQLNLKGCTLRATTVHLAPECNGDHRLATPDNTLSACLHCHGVIDGARS